MIAVVVAFLAGVALTLSGVWLLAGVPVAMLVAGVGLVGWSLWAEV